MASPTRAIACAAAVLAVWAGLVAGASPWQGASLLRANTAAPPHDGAPADPQAAHPRETPGVAAPGAAKAAQFPPAPRRTAAAGAPLPDSCNATFNAIYNAEVAPRLGAGQHYMDFTGSGVYLDSQVSAAAAQLTSAVFGNPHSQSPSSARTTALVDALRADLLAFFRADPEEYDLVFTRSATGALQALGEAFRWGPASAMAYLLSNHNSVLGVREYAVAGGAQRVGAVEEDDVEAWLADPGHPRWAGTVFGAGGASDEAQGGGYVGENCEKQGKHRHGGGGGGKNSSSDGPAAFSLFAYPAQDNFAGVLYPLDWVSRVQARSTGAHRWLVLLDTAAFVPAHRLDLSAVKPDFAVVSFYKMFGLPTGVGAWLVRKDAGAALRRVYWGGGSVFTATSALRWHVRHEGHERWEDGTLPFLDIMALRQGLDAMERLGGIDSVEAHVACISRHLSRGLASLRHSDGSPMVRLVGRHDAGAGAGAGRQGSVANFQLLKPAAAGGGELSYKAAAAELAAAGFHLREGCMCNPGACYRAVGVTDEEVRAWAEAQAGEWASWEWIRVRRNGVEVRRPLGTLRASLGWMSRVQDVDALVGFLIRRYRDRVDDGEVPPGWDGPGKC